MTFASTINLICSHLIFIGWLQNHLLPCPFKYFTGIDCPGCGFQRSMIALLKGDLKKSFALYPPAIPILFAWAYAIVRKYVKLDDSKNTIFKTVCIIVGLMVMISYGFKMWHLYGYSKLSV